MDGHEVELAGNIGSPKDVEGVLNNGGEGVGLFRTEFLYMDSQDFPTEEEQYVAYKAVLEGMNGKKVVSKVKLSEEVVDPEKEISLAEAQEIKKSYKLHNSELLITDYSWWNL